MLRHCQPFASRKRLQDIGIRMVRIVLAHLPEIVVGAQYGASVGCVEFNKIHPERQSVGEAAPEQFFARLFLREVLMQQQQVVAEVEISFLRIPLS